MTSPSVAPRRPAGSAQSNPDSGRLGFRHREQGAAAACPDPSQPARAARKLLLAATGLGSAAATGAATAQISFGPHEVYSGEVSDACLGDFNGDGHLDLAVGVNGREHRIDLYANTGDGQFVRMAEIADVSPGWLVAADFDNDGWTDLAAFNWDSPGSFEFYYNNGGWPAERYEFPAPNPGYNIAAADLTGDGQVDIVYPRGYDASVDLITHLGRGQYEHSVLYRHPDLLLSTGVAIGDLDGDGDQDVAALFCEYERYYTYKTHVHALLMDGRGGLEEVRTSDIEFSGDFFPNGIQVGDLDGDGDADAVVVARPYRHYQYGYWNIGTARQIVVTNDGLAQFTAGPRISEDVLDTGSVDLTDLDGDGRLDVVWGMVPYSEQATLHVRRNIGNLEFEPALEVVIAPIWATPRMDVADLNGDGRVDVAAWLWSRGVFVLLNDTPYDGPALDHTPLHRGREGTLTVRDAEPGKRVHFLVSREGAGNSFGIRQLGGITLDLLDPIQVIGSAVADGNGVAELTVNIPPNAPLTTVVMQAVIRRGPGGVESVKTPFRTAQVLP